MKRVIILGPGGSGKSTMGRRLGEILGIPVIELDKIFWQPGLAAMPRPQWLEAQKKLAEKNKWIMEGDLGPYDDLEGRLPVADTIIFLDFSLARCAWRVARRGLERADFWLWLLNYRNRYRPMLMAAMSAQVPRANLYVLPDPGAVGRFLAEVTSSQGKS